MVIPTPPLCINKNMVTMPTRAATPQTSRLLTIPGEIRNRIYDLAVADVLDKATFPGLAHPQRKAQTLREAQSLTRNWRLFRRSCLGLTQICRQLRDEFLPVYRARIPIAVRLNELEEYICVFVWPHKIANINVEVYDITQTTELRDVILLCATSPSILIDFGRNRIPMQKLLTYPEDYGGFYTFLIQQADRIMVVPTSYEMSRRDGRRYKSLFIDRLEVYVKRKFGQEWMKAPLEKLDVNFLGKWRMELGLPHGVNVVPRVDELDQATWDWSTGSQIVVSKP